MTSGILIIDKPEGLTSHDVVARLRRILKTKRIGHTGTLDPFATGVLVMLVGKATRLAQFLDKDKKEYEATVRFGFETDTGDVSGSPKQIQNSKFKIQNEEIKEVLKDFRGEIEQTPPMYSAKKVAGKKLYELARKGVEIERKSVKVTIYEIEITKDQKSKTADLQKNDFGLWTLDVDLRVLCSAGTYIRTLAEDIGKKLEIGAHLAALRRTRAGQFDLSKAVTLEESEEIVSKDKLGEVLISMNDTLAHLPKVILSSEEVKNIQTGKKLKFEDAEIANNQAVRMIDEAENLLAVGFYDKEQKFIQPRIVVI
ncbi:MAG TPA: tRNA pseudouridine(55) synthase TruB [Pyrinomonadaceae bacterium]|nr:tRNA pseudouridine(55) synthase TruB [Pyrinomonadaceae bacterium]